MKELLSRVRAAVEKYDMIPPGASVAVGVSGGKDSMAALAALAKLRDFYPGGFTLTALTADPCFGGEKADYSAITRYCESLGVEHIIRQTRLYEIVFVERREHNPCSLCARMRRGILHTMAKEAGCDTVALGHHADDAAQTVLMNLLCEGRFGGLPPKSWLDRRELTVIRPLIFCEERLCANIVQHLAIPTVKSKCPADGGTQRARAAQLIKTLEEEYPDLRAKLTGAAERYAQSKQE